ncbi:MAG: hypothetical protein ACXAEU_03585 [Candidatus Hodarchaeales archaeon]
MSLIGNVISLVTIAVRFTIGVKLLSVSRRTNMKNLQTLSIVFLLNSLALAFTLDFINQFILFYLMIDIAMVFHLLFTKQTFFADLKSPFKVILSLTIVFAVLNVITAGIYALDDTLENISLISRIFFALATYVVWGWFFQVAYTSYKRIAPNRSVEDWIKARYRLMIYYAVFILIPVTLLIFSTSQEDMFTILAAVIAIASWTLQFIVWVMPERIRVYLNRNYTTSSHEEESQSDDEIMKALVD